MTGCCKTVPRTIERCSTKAAAWAVDAHHGQERASGEPYFHHALAVAEILNDLKLDYETLAAAMLHDVVEDTEVTLDDVREEFGPVIARMVDGVTKMERIGEFQKVGESVDENQAENLRKLLLAMAEDVRVVLIKLADRLHNMRTLATPGHGQTASHCAGNTGYLRTAGQSSRYLAGQVGTRGPVTALSGTGGLPGTGTTAG